MVSSVLAQAILSQKTPNIVGSFREGQEISRQGKVKELSSLALKEGGGESLDQLIDLDPEVGLALCEHIGARSAKDLNDFIASAKIGLNQLNNGDVPGFISFGEQRIATLKQQGRNTTQTEEAINLAKSGDVEGARQRLQGFVGAIDQAKQPTKGVVVGGRVVNPITGEVVFESDDAAKKDSDRLSLERDKLEQRRLEREQRQKQFESKSGELKPGVQKILDASQTAATESGARARQLSLLAGDLKRAGDIGGGKAAGFSEFLKERLGTQDDVSELRRRYNAIRSSEAVQNLPPGVASDKDIELALKGFPREDAPKQQLLSFLRGSQKLAEFQRDFNNLKSEFISEKGSTRGLLAEVKKRFSEGADQPAAEAPQAPQKTISVDF